MFWTLNIETNKSRDLFISSEIVKSKTLRNIFNLQIREDAWNFSDWFLNFVVMGGLKFEWSSLWTINHNHFECVQWYWALNSLKLLFKVQNLFDWGRFSLLNSLFSLQKSIHWPWSHQYFLFVLCSGKRYSYIKCFFWLFPCCVR